MEPDPLTRIRAERTAQGSALLAIVRAAEDVAVLGYIVGMAWPGGPIEVDFMGPCYATVSDAQREIDESVAGVELVVLQVRRVPS